MPTPSNPSILGRLVYHFVLAYSSLCRRLPQKGLVVFGTFFGTLGYFLDVRHRRTIIRNLAFAYGKSRDRGEIRRLALKNFQQFAITAHEWLCLKDLDFEQLQTHVTVKGLENLKMAKASGRSVILVGAHFGNWEYGHIYYAKKINRLNFIVRAIENPFLEQERVSYNSEAGVNILYKHNGLRAAIRGLKRGEDLVIFVDRNTNLKEGIPCIFFGKKAPALTIAVQLAKRLKLPMLPMFTIRSPSGIGHELVFLPEIELDEGHDGGLENAVQKLCSVVESMIRKHPDHWIWFHKRWKHFYPQLYPEDIARRERRRAKRRKTRLNA